MSTTNLTFNAGTSLFKVMDNTTAIKRLYAGDLTYNNIWIASTNTGTHLFYNSPTFNEFKTDAGRTVYFTAGTTTTATTFTVDGTSGNNTVLSSYTTSPAIIAKAGGGTVDMDYVTITYLNATPDYTFYTTNSTITNSEGWDMLASYSGPFPTFRVI